MQFFNIIKETAKSISQGLSLTVLERGSYMNTGYTPTLRSHKK